MTSDQHDAGSGAFTKAFMPGLVLGLVVGLFGGVVGSVFVQSPSTLNSDAPTIRQSSSETDGNVEGRDGLPYEQETQQAVEDAVEEVTESPAAEEPAETDGTEENVSEEGR